MIEITITRNPNGTETYIKAKIIYVSLKQDRARVKTNWEHYTALPENKRDYINNPNKYDKRYYSFA